MGYKIIGEKVKAIFIERINRFEAKVLLNNEEIIVHVPNTGRLRELLVTNVVVYLLKSNSYKRKHQYTLMFVEKNNKLICINSALANRVVEEAIKEGALYLGEGILKREVIFYNSKFDLYIDGNEKAFIEVKCATFEEDGIAKFPDAPTERGRKHIYELIKAAEMGYKAKIIFIAFMDYAIRFEPYWEIDEEFAKVLSAANKKGVEILAYGCNISLEEISIKEKIDIKI
ncbi:Sugar fermentation stimulation protein A [Caloramator mitchellensis]|uniref:Sugar fermentation stimulation protein homolog n=1 Tax=Caloramator mitchellensis TaxID=908809 RepID=A0A0R3JVR3_CALMK|nr:DNA/RNA nuclease SfsA [Caloramator mitchellensis]KRQ87146.1 Sugar fermentation stimulation protein A [Caloramator mitchellensis]